MKEAESDGLISAEGVEYLNYFRLVVNDLFRLLDKENTSKLRIFVYNKDADKCKDVEKWNVL